MASTIVEKSGKFLIEVDDPMEQIKVHDAVYAYQTYGEGPPVVMLHGFTGTHRTWQPFVRMFQDAYRLLLIDLPGHGKTYTETNRTMELLCDDLKTLFDQLGFKKVHLIGYSMGGRVALSFAIQYPEYIQSLTLESASPGLKSASERLKRRTDDEHLARKIEKEGIRKFVDYWESIPLFHSQKKLPNDIQNRIRKERLSQSEIGLASALRWMGTGMQPSWWEHLKSISHPLLLIVGGLDHKFVMINKEIKSLVPHAELKIIKNSGHAVHVEQPNQFGEIVKQFIHTGQNHSEEENNDC